MTKVLILCLFLCILVIFSGCTNINQPTTINTRFDIIEIDGCEYYFINSGGSLSLCHKGNCKNPIHIYKEKH